MSKNERPIGNFNFMSDEDLRSEAGLKEKEQKVIVVKPSQNHLSVSKSDYITGEIPVEKMINDRIPSHRIKNEPFFDEEDVFGHTDPNGGWGKQMEIG